LAWYAASIPGRPLGSAALNVTSRSTLGDSPLIATVARAGYRI
jgi:hypothetical protein